MRLRNKKTGEITSTSGGDVDLFIVDEFNMINHKSYSSLAGLNAEWEDYKPKEPLIKDEKIRKAVRAQVEANDFLDEIEIHTLTAGSRFSIGHYDIEFLGYFVYDLEANKTYTITELCGEEE